MNNEAKPGIYRASEMGSDSNLPPMPPLPGEQTPRRTPDPIQPVATNQPPSVGPSVEKRAAAQPPDAQPVMPPHSRSGMRASVPSVPSSASQNSAPRTGGRLGVATIEAEDFNLNELLLYLNQVGGSDLHLTAGSPPMLRLHGSLEPIANHSKLQTDSLARVLFSILTQKQREQFEENLELDFSYSIPRQARYRVNIYRQRESVGAAFRLIPFEIKPLEELGIPASVAQFAELPRGIVLVTGATGSGKS